jgi:hypothetical protein
MPALPNVPNVARIQLHHTLGTDSNVVNSLHCRFSGTTSESSLNEWALAVNTAWVAHLAPELSPNLILNSVEITDLTSTSSATGSDIQNSPGTAATGSVPAQVAMIISYQINRRYRGGHPRQYLAGLPTGALQDEDHWLTSVINAWEAAYTLFATSVAAFSGSGTTASQIVSLSYVAGHTWEQDQRGNWHKIPTYRSSPLIDVVNGYIAQPIVGTQRRRAQK